MRVKREGGRDLYVFLFVWPKVIMRTIGRSKTELGGPPSVKLKVKSQADITNLLGTTQLKSQADITNLLGTTQLKSQADITNLLGTTQLKSQADIKNLLGTTQLNKLTRYDPVKQTYSVQPS